MHTRVTGSTEISPLFGPTPKILKVNRAPDYNVWQGTTIFPEQSAALEAQPTIVSLLGALWWQSIRLWWKPCGHPPLNSLPRRLCVQLNPESWEISRAQLPTKTIFLNNGTVPLPRPLYITLFITSRCVLERPITPRTPLDPNLRRTGITIVLHAMVVRKAIF